ncbi:T9SS type A sorting domain-containing protein [Lentimicrobium sp. L6]|uniref:T9SS type A sorting domain-containing protein n=1 Tax=Lentimicrobium sp. L6 TaxID=2735916 RepID=UPI0015559BB8|nr:T9SS type A sorting domain-containing protein [Lentimicrobium sp. L6]NPD83705.1 T9SS type A sorting domain-containing protein [Lentimicrobium sp. L6]
MRYVLPYRGNPMTQIGNTNDYIGCTGERVFKYNIETGDYQTVSPPGALLGSFFYDQQGYCYYRANNEGDTRSYKMNVSTLEYEKIDLNIFFRNPIINPINDNELLTWRVNGATEQLTAVYLNSYETSVLAEQEKPIRSRVGRIIADNHKLYSMATLVIDGKMSFFIDSYDLDTDSYNEEFIYTNDSLEYHSGINWLKGFVMDSGGKLYGAGKLVPKDNRFYMFSYDPSNSIFEILAPIPEEVGNSLIGNLVIDDEQKIFGNSVDGGAHDFGGVFSYNTLTNEIDLVYSYLPESNFETKSALSLAPDGAILGMFSTIDTNIHRHIYKIDNESFTYQNLKTISMNPNVYGGFYPTDFTQLENGGIIGITSKGGNTYEPYYGGGTLYQFNPETKAYQKLMNIVDEFPDATKASQVFTTSENKVLGFYYGVSEKSFLYNPETKQLEYVSEEGFSPYHYKNKWLRESGSSLIRANNSTQKMERYHISSHEIEELVPFGNLEIDQMLLMDENNLLCQARATDSAVLMNFNIPSQEMSIVANLKDYKGDYSGYDYSSINFNFVKTAEHLLVGEFIEKLYYSKWDIAYRKTVSFDLSTLEMRTLNSGNSKANGTKYSFIADYNNNGDAFAVNVCRHYGDDAGFLRQVDVTMDSIYNIDEFEMPSWIYELDAEEEESGFRILKKLKSTKKPDFINEMEEAKIIAFYANQAIVINSEEYIKQAEFSIFDMMGRRVSSFSRANFTQTEQPLNIEAGTYVLQIKLDSRLLAEKFVIPL